MKVDNTFDKTELLQKLSTAYDLPLQSITFFPEGEDSYGYITVAETGEKYFAKASTSVPNSRLHVASLLRHRCNITGVVAPLETQEGELSVPWHNFRVSLFPLIEGKSRWDLWKVGKDFTDAELSETGALLATIHGCPETIVGNHLTVAKYDYLRGMNFTQSLRHLRKRSNLRINIKNNSLMDLQNTDPKFYRQLKDTIVSDVQQRHYKRHLLLHTAIRHLAILLWILTTNST